MWREGAWSGQQAKPRCGNQPNGVLVGLQSYESSQTGDGSGIPEDGGMERVWRCDIYRPASGSSCRSRLTAFAEHVAAVAVVTGVSVARVRAHRGTPVASHASRSM